MDAVHLAGIADAGRVGTYQMTRADGARQLEEATNQQPQEEEAFDEIQDQLEHSTGQVAVGVQKAEFNVATGTSE